MQATVPQSAEAICLSIYEETRRYPPIANLADLGFEILMGPPFREPQILFIGYQPGDWSLSAEQARLKGYENHWVTDACQYALESWPLARRLQQIFDRELLSKCVGLNAIFVRARNIDAYNSRVGIEDKKAIEAFCLNRVDRIVNLLSPRMILVIGLQTLDLFGGGVVSLTSRNGNRPLMKTGEVSKRKAHAVIHLTGAWISSDDRAAIKSTIHGELASCAAES